MPAVCGCCGAEGAISIRMLLGTSRDVLIYQTDQGNRVSLAGSTITFAVYKNKTFSGTPVFQKSLVSGIELGVDGMTAMAHLLPGDFTARGVYFARIDIAAGGKDYAESGEIIVGPWP